MSITTYTTFDEVRAALGLDDEELTDSTLGLQIYDDQLNMDFASFSGDIPTKFQEVSAETTKTNQQKLFISAVRLFATYSVARQVGTALPMLAPKEISDGKALVTRFTSDPYRKTLMMVEDSYNKYRGYVESSFSTLSSSTVVQVPIRYFGSVGLSVDPVTGQ